MEIKELLGEELTAKVTSSSDELIKQIVGKLSNAKIMSGDPTQYVPKADFNEKIEIVKSLKAQIAKADEDMKTIKADAESIPALKAKITDMQTASKAERDQFEAAQIKAKKSNALLIALMDNGVIDPAARELLSKSFNLDTLKLGEDGKPEGFDTLLKPIKENPTLKNLFGTVKLVGQEHQRGDISTEQFFTREQVQAMDQATVSANLEKVNKSMATWK